MSAADFGALRLAISTTAAELERITARVAELQTDPAAPYDAAVDAARQALGDAKAASLLGTDDEAAVQAAELALQSAEAAHAQTRALTQDQAAVQAGYIVFKPRPRRHTRWPHRACRRRCYSGSKMSTRRPILITSSW